MNMKPKNFYGLISPRPTVCISTISPEGTFNIGPYSFVSPVSFNPPLIGVSVGKGKDTILNARDAGDFVVVPVTEGWMDKGIRSEISLPRDESEYEKLGLKEKNSEKVNSPGVEEAPINIECEYWDELDAGDHVWLVGKVVHIDAEETAVKNGRMNIEELGSVCHLMGEEFCISDEVTIIKRG